MNIPAFHVLPTNPSGHYNQHRRRFVLNSWLYIEFIKKKKQIVNKLFFRLKKGRERAQSPLQSMITDRVYVSSLVVLESSGRVVE